MKKGLFIGIATILVMATCIAGFILGRDLANKEFEVKSNTLELEGNPTTGYEWTCNSKDESVLTVTTKYQEDKKDEEVVGTGGKYIVTLKGIKEGETSLVCKYKRSWEETESDSEKNYKVTVSKDLEVKYLLQND